MKRTYFCPHCAATLNPNVKVILAVTAGRTRGLLLLSPQPGNYEKIIPPELRLEKGSIVDLFCPVCRADLALPSDPNLAMVGFRLASGVEGTVRFSRRVGEYATYVITGEEVRSYGEDAERYGSVNFFGEGKPERD